VKLVVDEHYKQIQLQQRRNQDALQAALSREKEVDILYEKLFEDICCKGRKSNPSNTVRAAGSSVAV